MARRDLRDKCVLVTGATSGIGAALARVLAAAGANLLITGRRADRLAALYSELPPGRCLEPIAGDITQPAIRAMLVDTARQQWGRLDSLVNNAGIGGWGPFASADEARLRYVMEVNFFAPAELIRGCLPLLRQGRRPLIVNVGSVLGQRAVPDKSEYCASKFALHGLSDALRAELAAEQIDVLHARPSTTRTEFFERALSDQSGVSTSEPITCGMSPEAAAACIVRAMRRNAHEVILSPGGKLLVWVDRMWPWLADRLIARYAPRRPMR